MQFLCDISTKFGGISSFSFFMSIIYLSLLSSTNTTMDRWQTAIVLLLLTLLSPSVLFAHPLMVPSSDAARSVGDEEKMEDSDDRVNRQDEDLSELSNLASTILQYLAGTETENCTRASLAHINYNFTVPAEKIFGNDVQGALQTANLLNSVFQSQSYGVSPVSSNAFTLSVTDSKKVYFALAQALLESTTSAYGGGIAFRRGESPVSSTNLFAPFVHRTEGDKTNRVHLEDLADVWDQEYDRKEVPGTDWFLKAIHRPLPHQITATSVSESAEGLNVSQFVLSTPNQGVWSAPFFDCRGSNTWLLAYAVPFYSVEEKRLKAKGVVVLMFDMSKAEVNQCANDDSFFADTHRCERLTMQCTPIHGQGLQVGAYTCSCRSGFYFPDSEMYPNVFNGTYVESLNEMNALSEWHCLPCQPGCEYCTNDTPCFVEYDIFLRGLPLGIQSFCMTITILMGVAVFRLRKTITIAAGMWTMLEMILLGALLLYATVVCRYFEPTTISCLLEPWFRELGFATLYGAIVLKIYRILVEFRTRKAHRWVIKDKDLLKYLAGILLVVTGYMAAWTAINLHLLKDGHIILSLESTPTGLHFFACRSAWWEHVTDVGELLFLLFGVYLSYHVRNASSDFREKRYLCLAIFFELLVSVSLQIIRYALKLDIDPDFIFLLYFGRCQLTVTLILLLIFGPKFWYYHKPPRDVDSESRGEQALQEAVKLQDGVTSNGEVDLGDINLADMDPEDIRAELRRVYTQLQILRNKTMRKDNPHISKRRGGRKATHRRFSLQVRRSHAFHHRHRHHHETEHDGEASKTPEESIASTEGATAPTETATITTAAIAAPVTTVSSVSPSSEQIAPVLTVTFKD